MQSHYPGSTIRTRRGRFGLEGRGGRDAVAAVRAGLQSHRLLTAAAGATLIVVLLAVIASFFIDEPLRRSLERTMNSKLHGYNARLPGLSFHPLGFSLTLRDLTVTQAAH